LELELTLPRPTYAATVHLRGALAPPSATFRGQSVTAREEGGWHIITLVPGDERRLLLSLSGVAAPELVVSELTLGLPPLASSLLLARGPAAITSQLGDVTLKRVSISPTAQPESAR
jgi:hypothetical protein